MKQTMKYMSIAALVAVGAIMMGCNKLEEQPLQNDNNTVTLTTTVSLDAATKALTAAGVKTFAADDQIAVIYKNTSNETVKAVSEVIGTEAGTASATFTVTLTNPDKTKAIRYIYPAAMAKATVATDATIDDDGTVDFTNLNKQNGLLTTLGSNLDLSTFDAASWGGDVLPNGTLSNQLAILALTLKNSTGSSDITSTITGVTITDGTYSYTVTRTAAAGPIYVAIRPTSSAAIEVTATDGTNNYTKSLTGKTYAANNGYSVSWKMILTGAFTINSSGTQVKFAQGNLQATNNTANSTTGWTWSFAAHQYDFSNANANTAVGNNVVTTAGTVDLFGWVGNTSSLAAYGINNNIDNSNYGNKTSNTLKSDWGVAANAASLGGYSNWRTLTSAEWEYIFNTRAASTVNGTANARYAKATVAGKTGMILFPDTYTHPSGVTAPASINTASAEFTVNNYDATAWGKMETAGCVFLPAAGYRNGTSMNVVGSYGYYWSSTPSSSDANRALFVRFGASSVDPAYSYFRNFGRSVRLVRQVE